MKLLLACWLLLPASIVAHPGKGSVWNLFLGPDGLTGRIVVPVCGSCPTAVSNDRLLRLFSLRSEHETARNVLRGVDRRDAEVELLVRFEFSRPPGVLELASTFFELTGPGHDTLCRVCLPGRVEAFRLDVTAPSRSIRLAPSNAYLPPALLAFAALFLLRLGASGFRCNIKPGGARRERAASTKANVCAMATTR